ncbi:MAG: hypothetical protein WB870_11170 [Gallionellaceae bacterium]
MSKRIRCYISVLMILLLSGCLGGNGSSAPVVSTLSFPLQGAYKSFVANGFSNTFTVSGTDVSGICDGTGTQSVAPASTAATFEGVAGFSAVDTLTMSLTNCTTVASIVNTVTNFYDTNYTPLGYINAGVEYGVYLSQPSIPTSVNVYDNGPVGTIALYTDSTKSVGLGRIDVTYVIGADTANTAIVNLISRRYDTTNTALSTEQDSYRIASTGALIPVSVTLQRYASTLNLVGTFN